MVKCVMGMVEMKGIMPELMFDTEVILRSLREALTKKYGEEKAIQYIDKIVEESKKSIEDANKEAEKDLDKFDNELFKELKKSILKKLMEELDDE